MAEHSRRSGLGVKIDAFNQQVSGGNQVAIRRLSDDGCIIADSGVHSRGMFSRVCLFAEAANEIEFVHARSSEIIKLQVAQ